MEPSAAKNDTGLTAEALPDQLSVAVMLERRPSASEWVDYRWDVIGVFACDRQEKEGVSVTTVSEDEQVTRYLYEGFLLRLYKDECESYYHNLMAPNPSCYVVSDPDEEGTPHPCLVSLSFDEAHAYLEGEEEVYSVPLSPELYRWSEAFVLTHYVPEKKTKRKLANWKMPGANNSEGRKL